MRIGTLIAIIVTVAAATLLFHLFVHQISGVWLDMMVRPEMKTAIEQSLADQKRLRDLDPANAQRYRQRFEERRRLLNRIEVVSMNRERLVRRFDAAVSATFAVMLFTATLLWTLRQRRNEERRRREDLERFAGWQDASRRHAHEIKTPLTAARMEIERLVSLTKRGAPDPDITRSLESVCEEFDRLARFTKEFSSFAAIRKPELRAEDAVELLQHFCEMFANAWPQLALRVAPSQTVKIRADRDLLRQVLVNLVTNSAHAIDGNGSVTFTVTRAGDRVFVDVSDTGSGIPESIQPRVFEPYVTTRNVGDGMGLGLAISRKILLDHGGDLTLLASSASGTTFRLTFVRAG